MVDHAAIGVVRWLLESDNTSQGDICVGGYPARSGRYLHTYARANTMHALEACMHTTHPTQGYHARTPSLTSSFPQSHLASLTHTHPVDRAPPSIAFVPYHLCLSPASPASCITSIAAIPTICTPDASLVLVGLVVVEGGADNQKILVTSVYLALHDGTHIIFRSSHGIERATLLVQSDGDVRRVHNLAWHNKRISPHRVPEGAGSTREAGEAGKAERRERRERRSGGERVVSWAASPSSW